MMMISDHDIGPEQRFHEKENKLRNQGYNLMKSSSQILINADLF